MRFENLIGVIRRFFLSFLLILLVSCNFTSIRAHQSNAGNIIRNTEATPDIYEDDNDFSSAKSIDVNTQQIRSISPVNDCDFIIFTIESLGVIQKNILIFIFIHPKIILKKKLVIP